MWPWAWLHLTLWKRGTAPPLGGRAEIMANTEGEEEPIRALDETLRSDREEEPIRALDDESLRPARRPPHRRLWGLGKWVLFDTAESNTAVVVGPSRPSSITHPEVLQRL